MNFLPFFWEMFFNIFLWCVFVRSAHGFVEAASEALLVAPAVFLIGVFWFARNF